MSKNPQTKYFLFRLPLTTPKIRKNEHLSKILKIYLFPCPWPTDQARFISYLLST